VHKEIKQVGAPRMYRVPDTVRSTYGQDGAIVLDVQRGQILRLNSTASLIFQRLQKGETEAQIMASTGLPLSSLSTVSGSKAISFAVLPDQLCGLRNVAAIF
jgi:hypothetical protein